MKISKELTRMERKMDMGGTCGRTMRNMREIGLRAKSTDLVPIDGQMEESSQVNG